MNAAFNSSKVTFIPVLLFFRGKCERFFIVKFHYAKSDFKYNDQFLSDQRHSRFSKSIKINWLCFFC
ncbi:hypothetical protein EKO14_11455 [Enterobacter bugandensis]|nr:hypothetical protein FAI37_05805 [Enterobacter bugandensis]RTM29360.1 hypothetical protein EKO14_11455 [Enterobacter bugandensis]